MSDPLSPQARALLRASREALRASSADRERIAVGLRQQLGSDALPSDAGAAPVWGLSTPPVIATLAIGACLVGAVALLMSRPRPSAPAPQKPAASASPASDAHAPIASHPETAVPTAPAPSTPSEPRAAPVARRRDSLAQEVTLLSRATRALGSGDAAAALEVLEQHQRSFPNGALSEERRAAKAQALCALGRFRQGQSELARLAPSTPAAARARQACDAQPDEGDRPLR